MACQEVSEELWKQKHVDLLSCEQYPIMIINKIKVFLQNIWKNNLITNIILETCKELDIILIQQSLKFFIYSIPSLSNANSNRLIEVPNHPGWLTFSRSSSNNEDYLCMVSYINICLSCFQFALCKDVFNHRNISCFSFFNNGNVYFMINIYSDNKQFVWKYLKDTEVNIHNVLIMTDNFNIRDSIWDSSYFFHLAHSDILFDISLSSPLL